MKENQNLIKIRNTKSGQPCVSARELHQILEVKTRYNDWINERIKKYEFVENVDFLLVTEKKVTNNPKNPYSEISNHMIKLDMAKELAMVENNERGKQVRKYFIEVEKRYNDPVYQLSKSLIYANEQLQIKDKEINSLKLTLKDNRSWRSSKSIINKRIR